MASSLPSRRRLTLAVLLALLAVSCIFFYVGTASQMPREPSASALLLLEENALPVPVLVSPPALFCSSNAQLEGAAGSSRFNEIVGDSVRAAAANPAAKTSKATLSSFVGGLSEQAPCFWARYTSLPLPSGAALNMSMCTHDPKVDTVISVRIHTSGVWFGTTAWSEFSDMLVDGSCPADRPVVLDLGLNIGYVPGLTR
jgi:hypothetical protein